MKAVLAEIAGVSEADVAEGGFITLGGSGLGSLGGLDQLPRRLISGCMTTGTPSLLALVAEVLLIIFVVEVELGLLMSFTSGSIEPVVMMFLQSLSPPRSY